VAHGIEFPNRRSPQRHIDLLITQPRISLQKEAENTTDSSQEKNKADLNAQTNTNRNQPKTR